MNATPNPDPDALAWLDAHLADDDAALIEALPDAAVHAELRELGLDASRLTLPAPPGVRPARQDRAAVPRGRRFRPGWFYAAASVLLVVAASVVVLREAPEVPTLPPAASSETPQAKAGPVPEADAGKTPAGKTPLGPAPPMAAPAPEEAAPRASSRAVVKEARPDFPPVGAAGDVARDEGGAAERAAPAAAEALPAPAPPPVRARQAAPKSAYTPMRAEVALSLDDALAHAEAAPASPADTTAPESDALRAAIAVLTRAYEADAPADAADTPYRKRLAAALAQAYTALGDAEQARRWTLRAKQP